MLNTRARVLQYVAEQCQKKNGRPPTCREISSELGISFSGAAYHLRGLADHKLLASKPGHAWRKYYLLDEQLDDHS